MRLFSKLKITGKTVEGKIQISVEDDGIGIKEETLTRLNNLKAGKEQEHFGIFSVKNRIALYFGDEASFKILSEENKGTTAIITLPRIEGDMA